MLRAIQNLREIAQNCSETAPFGYELSAWLAKSIDDFLKHRVQSIDEALGLKGPVGGVPWWREEQMRARDRLLKEAAALFFGELSVCAQARHIRLASLRYAASAWRFDRHQDAMPERYRNALGEWLWRAFKSGAPMPIGERHLRTILAGAKVSPGDAGLRAKENSGTRAGPPVRLCAE